ncbi:hypothetical protein caldi_22580 [Caldinitratiruptor microaerophilus]|uniref:RNA polymerase sigma-70 factor, ECF subfamily n=1 Tax=Caldinitratiruptor microaerophilus TaxID=671077 RepID=A0AA35CMM6_9FIRM|nr:hypothetical protein caldi_22580 [Caldinitratiruptor microaerophilus]
MPVADRMRPEENEFFTLLAPEQGKLYRLALALLGNEADARDALQESVVHAFFAYRRLRGGKATFVPWMRRIVVNSSLQILRRRWRLVPVGRPEKLRPEPGRSLPDPPGEVWDAVRRLDEHYRVVVVLRFLNDMSLDAIGRTLGIPLGTVKSRLHVALRRLRRMLDQSGAGKLQAV